MLGRLTLGAVFIAATTALTASSAFAVTPAQLSVASETNGMLVQVKKKGGGIKNGGGAKVHHHHRHHRRGVTIGVGVCTIARAECANEYGSGTRSYYRCLRRRGC